VTNGVRGGLRNSQDELVAIPMREFRPSGVFPDEAADVGQRRGNRRELTGGASV